MRVDEKCALEGHQCPPRELARVDFKQGQPQNVSELVMLTDVFDVVGNEVGEVVGHEDWRNGVE